MTAAADDAPSFQLLHQLPPELFDFILASFCDGKSLRTLQFALLFSTDEFCEQSTQNTVPSVIRNKLLGIAAILQTSGLACDESNTNGAVRWVEAMANTEIEGTRRLQLLFENTFLLDFMNESLKNCSETERGHLEWPVWCGEITVHSTINETRMSHRAAVVITSSMKWPAFLPGTGLLEDPPVARALFRCEPYRMVSLPPWGRLRGLSEAEDHILAPLAERLHESNEVAVPTRGYNVNLDIRITSAKQSQSENARTVLRWCRQSRWIADCNGQNSLICCWQDEAPVAETSHRDYIPHIIRLVKVRQQLLNTREAMGDHCVAASIGN